MKKKICLVVITAVILICRCVSVYCENASETIIAPDEEWSWSRGAYNTFSGQIDMSDCTGREITVRISTELPYNDETEALSMPVFTSVNGKRIVMTKQSDTIRITPDDDNPVMYFTASFRLPEKQHVVSVTMHFHVADINGEEIKTVSGRIETSEEMSGRQDTPFYIPADIGKITLITASAAVMIWTAVLIRFIYIKKKGPKVRKNVSED